MDDLNLFFVIKIGTFKLSNKTYFKTVHNLPVNKKCMHKTAKSIKTNFDVNRLKFKFKLFVKYEQFQYSSSYKLYIELHTSLCYGQIPFTHWRHTFLVSMYRNAFSSIQTNETVMYYIHITFIPASYLSFESVISN